MVYYCLNHGSIPSSVRKTADNIIRAQSHPMQISDPCSDIENIINTELNDKSYEIVRRKDKNRNKQA